jgi:hypothetical protein
MTDLFNRTNQERAADTARHRAREARRLAAAPLRPMAPQLPCDIGLFSDDARQTDLVDIARQIGRAR